MVALYLVSAEEAAGKTTIGVGLGKRWLEEGKKIGYIKLVTAGKGSADGKNDTVFMKQVLALAEPVDVLCPPVSKVKEVVDRLSRDKDVVIVEGRCGRSPEESLDQADYTMMEVLKARVMVVADFARQSPAEIINCGKRFGANLLGVVLNKVPASRLKYVAAESSPQFEAAGIVVLGVLPESRALFTVAVGELADSVQGEILNNAEKSAELVENLMAGAMLVDSGLEYFGRKTNKAAVVRGDRPDMQMAALETSTRCLVISGGTAPVDSVRYTAESKGVPIIVTGNDTDTIVKDIEEALGRARFNQEKKLLRLAELVESHLDFPAICRGLGLG
ncbi:MAG: DRTGG domain-containing protein [Dehalococcoidales bacterium]|nr:DRTGG domain-containing protein [Dehalococcoidales bacterium]MDP7415982.1 DRTGG domain-containing protein [Dehalococcoidales bacterium]